MREAIAGRFVGARVRRLEDRRLLTGKGRYIDGAVFSPSNADLVASLGFDLVIVSSPMSQAGKRVFDLLMSSLLLLFAGPLLAVLAVLLAQAAPAADVEVRAVFLTVTDDKGKPVIDGKPSVDASDRKLMKVALANLAPGTYTVSWVAVASDGHRTQGHYAFTVK